MSDKTKAGVLDLLRDVECGLKAIREESERDGNIPIKNCAAMQITRIKLALAIIEVSEL